MTPKDYIATRKRLLDEAKPCPCCNEPADITSVIQSGFVVWLYHCPRCMYMARTEDWQEGIAA